MSIYVPRGGLAVTGQPVTLRGVPVAPPAGPPPKEKARYEGNVYQVTVGTPGGPAQLTPEASRATIQLRALNGNDRRAQGLVPRESRRRLARAADGQGRLRHLRGPVRGAGEYVLVRDKGGCGSTVTLLLGILGDPGDAVVALVGAASARRAPVRRRGGRGATSDEGWAVTRTWTATPRPAVTPRRPARRRAAMTLLAPATTPPTRPALPVRERTRTLILAGCCSSGWPLRSLIRSAVGGAGVARSTPAALVFAGLLARAVRARLAAAANGTVRSAAAASSRVAAVALGLTGAVVLCVPAVLSSAPLSGSTPGGRQPGVPRRLPRLGRGGDGGGRVRRRCSCAACCSGCSSPAASSSPSVSPRSRSRLCTCRSTAGGRCRSIWRSASGSERCAPSPARCCAPAVAHVLADWAAYWLM